MPKRSFTPNQFAVYSGVKAPRALVWGLGALAATMGLALLSFALSPGRAPGAGTQIIVNILTGLVLVVPFAAWGWWWLTMSRFTARKETALMKTLYDLDWAVDAQPEIDAWPVAPSSIVHNLDPSGGWQVPYYLRFNGHFAANPAELVLLDARYFRSSTKSAFIYLHIALRDSYPHTVVDGKDGLFRHDLNVRVGNVECLKFEGELHKYFTVFTVKGSGQDALYVFTPDLLEQLLDYGTGFNVEVIGNSLYIFAQPRLFDTPGGFAAFMNLGLHLTREFNQRSHNLRGKPFRYDPQVAERRMDLTSRR